MTFKRWLKKELKASAKFWFTPPPPRNVTRYEWKVLFYVDGDIRTGGTVIAGNWKVAMDKARKLARGKDVDRVQVKKVRKQI